MLGGSPNDSAQPQNILVRVASWTWISSPITGSWATSATRDPLEPDRLLERERRVEQPRLAERRAGQLHPHRQPLGETAGDRDRGDPRQRRRSCEVVGQVHRERVGGPLAELERD